MSSSRDPLGSLSTNCLPSRPPPTPAKTVYPIFLNRAGRVAKCKSSAASDSGCPADTHPSQDMLRQRKRVKHSCSQSTVDKRVDGGQHDRRRSISDYFTSRTPLRASCTAQASKQDAKTQPSVAWRRSRARLGQSRQDCTSKVHRPASTLSYMVTRTEDDSQGLPYSVVLPSVDSPSGRMRDYDPALVLAFSDSAKLYSSEEAQGLGKTRLLAIGGEEGGIRVTNVDFEASSQSSTTDHWWRAHENGVFDLKWTNDDTRLLSASADQSLRLFDLGSGTPRTLTTMLGHTSTIKSTAIIDSGPLGGGGEFSVIASGGRDGNINIYDLRCPGQGSSTRRSRRMRSTSSTVDSEGQIIEPVLTLRQPHNAPGSKRHPNDARSSSRTITSLVSLQTMPGILASGGTFDGVVKLWDIRVPNSGSSLRPKCTPYAVLPDPTTAGDNPSRRPRSVNALCENPTTGDLYALCADSQIHVLRPSAGRSSCDPFEAILPQKFVHPDLLMRSFYIRMSLSADGRYLACGSSHAGVMAWDTHLGTYAHTRVQAERFPIPHSNLATTTPEVIAVDWAKDILAASSDDSRTRLWRTNVSISHNLRTGDEDARSKWSGVQ